MLYYWFEGTSFNTWVSSIDWSSQPPFWFSSAKTKTIIMFPAWYLPHFEGSRTNYSYSFWADFSVWVFFSSHWGRILDYCICFWLWYFGNRWPKDWFFWDHHLSRVYFSCFLWTGFLCSLGSIFFNCSRYIFLAKEDGKAIFFWFWFGCFSFLIFQPIISFLFRVATQH